MEGNGVISAMSFELAALEMTQTLTLTLTLTADSRQLHMDLVRNEDWHVFFLNPTGS